MKKLLITKEQAKTLYESIDNAAQINEGLTVELLEFTQKLIEFILNELNDDTSRGLDRIWRELGVTRGELLSLLTDMGLIGVTFYKLTYSEKVKRIIDMSGILYRDITGKTKEPELPEGTGASSSGSFVGALGGQMNKPMKRGISPSQGIVSDSVNPMDKLKGLEVGTKTKRFLVSGVGDKDVKSDGSVFYIVNLTFEGEPVSSHILFKLDGTTGKATLKFNDSFESIKSADLAFPPAYHKNLNKIGNALVKAAKIQDEGLAPNLNKINKSTSGNFPFYIEVEGIKFDAMINGDYLTITNPVADDRKSALINYLDSLGVPYKKDWTGSYNLTDWKDYFDMNEGTGASANATYDAPGFDIGHKGKNLGQYKQNFNIYEKSKSPTLDKTTWDGGAFVEFDDCVNLNNSKVAQNGGCNQGDSKVVKLRKTKDSILSGK